MVRSLLTVCLLWALVIPASAEVYRWVDDNGVTHYGERPPQGRKAEELKQPAEPQPTPGSAAPRTWQEKELDFRKRRLEAEQAEAQAREREAARQRACNEARDQLAQMKMARRVYHLDEHGERVYESDAEREASVARQEQLVAERCR